MVAQQYQQNERVMATPEQIAAMMTVPEPFTPRKKEPYSGPIGPFVWEFKSMSTPVLKDKEYQNDRGDKYEAWFEFELVLDAAGNETGWGPGVNPATGEIEPGEIVRQRFTISLHEKSSLRPVVEALVGGKLKPSQQVTEEALKGLRMLATVNIQESQTTMVEVTDSQTGRTQNVKMTYPKLSGFSVWNPEAARAPQGRRQPVAQVAPQETEDVPF
jgi:hypothetical protein